LSQFSSHSCINDAKFDIGMDESLAESQVPLDIKVEEVSPVVMESAGAAEVVAAKEAPVPSVDAAVAAPQVAAGSSITAPAVEYVHPQQKSIEDAKNFIKEVSVCESSY